uniref:Uncharacterized protein n=1 Tax=Xenopus tropicalis TaxID=8364 RepID=A0A6I8QF20_XENTR
SHTYIGGWSNVGEGSKRIITHVLAARLPSVAHKLGLLIVVDGLSSHNSQHNAEDNQNSQPNLEARQEAPAHCASCSYSTNRGENV